MRLRSSKTQFDLRRTMNASEKPCRLELEPQNSTTGYRHTTNRRPWTFPAPQTVLLAPHDEPPTWTRLLTDLWYRGVRLCFLLPGCWWQEMDAERGMATGPLDAGGPPERRATGGSEEPLSMADVWGRGDQAVGRRPRLLKGEKKKLHRWDRVYQAGGQNPLRQPGHSATSKQVTSCASTHTDQRAF